ncbi:hypothetical protein GQ44DRAFT_779466 [Phaeosphaeriaceae sp. PMI808]|nr:hypothetical protein GQ44DRAFT_779466 [Phaeosphaeriaceae sp. PMI808]
MPESMEEAEKRLEELSEATIKEAETRQRRMSLARSTLHRRKHGGASKEAKAQLQQYLIPEEEKAMVKFLLLMSGLGHPVRIKFIPSLAFSIARRRFTVIKPIKPPGKN